MININFTAVDVETATFDRMICQIGIVKVENGEIVKELSWLVQPPCNRYDEGCIKIHGITPDMTSQAPTFDAVWSEVEPYLVNTVVVAHNASFDEDAIHKNLSYYGILSLGIPEFICTCNIFERRSLEDLCKGFKMETDKHHNAAFDAKCSALFYLKYLSGEKPDTSLMPVKTSSKHKQKERLKGDILVKDLYNANPNNPLYDKKIVVTGDFSIGRKEIGVMLKKMGADIDTAISKHTNFVLIGENPGPKKMEKLDKLIHDGYNIRKIFENDLQSILSGNWTGYKTDDSPVKALDLTISHYEKHHIRFTDGQNIIAGKELFYGKGFKGNFDLFNQITGNLGAFGDCRIYPETNICVLSDSTVSKLKNGEKDESILYIQDVYNQSKSLWFDYSFISENDILEFVKNRYIRCGDKNTLDLYEKYISSIK